MRGVICIAGVVLYCHVVALWSLLLFRMVSAFGGREQVLLNESKFHLWQASTGFCAS